MNISDEPLLSDRVTERQQNWLRETEGLVDSPIETPMLQPWEVYDQDLFDLEMVRIFGRSWVWLGDTEDLKEAGDFITGNIGYQPVVVIKQADGSVKGFLNNCRHRASGVAFGETGHCGKTLTCPYHNWSYGIDGSLRGIPDQPRMYPDGFPKDQYGLVPIRIEVAWNKLVFGCLSHQAPTFREWIAPIAERYDRLGIDKMTRFHRSLDETYPINWKAFAENSNDDYHVRFVHRRLNHTRKNLDTIVRFAGRTTSGYKPHELAVEDITGGRTDLPEEERIGHYADYIYPNLTPLPWPTALIMVRADPIAPDKTRLVSRIYGLDYSIEEQERQLGVLEVTNLEDTDMVTELMKNLRSPFYRVGPPSTWEGRSAHVMRLIRDDIATPVAPNEFVAPE